MGTEFDDEMMKALEEDGERLRQMTGEDHGPYFLAEETVCEGERQTFDEVVENCLCIWFFNYDETADNYAYRVAMREIVKFVASQYHVVGEAILDVFRERRRQIEVEGWDPGHDDQHTDGSMAQAAAAYALNNDSHEKGIIPYLWPDSWDMAWWKPTGRRRDLVKAAALIIAEIERLDRAANAATSLTPSPKSPYSEGYAAQKSTYVDECPYREGSPEYDAWHEGYSDADIAEIERSSA
ncbi:hypothetical protein HJB80_02915 [Rhizobium lentis]|uniref:hypothetical protein n=1 Tax=Rhizobium lentis TaxID=1138194 RepID=UPI001C82DF2D|nr:hypothetical protein [Rhizobium lentis]MBX5131644.1 hypothetical protein [Rhizobium lentis]